MERKGEVEGDLGERLERERETRVDSRWMKRENGKIEEKKREDDRRAQEGGGEGVKTWSRLEVGGC